jgi:hypothetical protein
VLRGFKVPVPVLDAFLRANSVYETYWDPPIEDDDKNIAALLRYEMIDEGSNSSCVRLVIPQHEGFNSSSVAYIVYSLAQVLAQRA